MAERTDRSEEAVLAETTASNSGGRTLPKQPKTRRRQDLRHVDLSVMRDVNRALVLDTVKREGPLSRVAIANASRLAKPTVSGIVDELITEGLITEIGPDPGTSGAGRPPVLLEFNARSHYVVGIHIGVENTIISLADAAGSEIDRLQCPTPRGDAVDVLQEIADAMERVLDHGRIARRRLAALGVCVAGVVDQRTGRCLFAPNLGWRDVPVRDILAGRLDLPTFVHNTVQAAAVAEDIEGAGRNCGDVVLLYSGLGVGAGVLHDGRIFHGAAGLAGEIGHCVIPGATEVCGCGKTGCVETLASAPAVARFARRAVADGRKTRLARLGEDITAIDVAAAAQAGDAVAIEILAHAGEALGIAASWLINLLNPEVLVIGGGLVGAGDPLLEPFRRAISANALPQAADRVVVRPWALGKDAKIRGAVLLALQRSDQYYRLVFGL